MKSLGMNEDVSLKTLKLCKEKNRITLSPGCTNIVKKLRRGDLNWDPPFPQGEDDNWMQTHKRLKRTKDEELKDRPANALNISRSAKNGKRTEELDRNQRSISCFILPSRGKIFNKAKIYLAMHWGSLAMDLWQLFTAQHAWAIKLSYNDVCCFLHIDD